MDYSVVCLAVYSVLWWLTGTGMAVQLNVFVACDDHTGVWDAHVDLINGPCRGLPVAVTKPSMCEAPWLALRFDRQQC